MNTRRSYPGKAAFVIANPKSALMDQIREVLRVKHYSLRTEEAYTGWVLRFLKFHRDQSGEWIHPRDLGSAEVVGFLNHLASAKAVSAATQNQALVRSCFIYSSTNRALRCGVRWTEGRPFWAYWPPYCRGVKPLRPRASAG